MSLSATVDCHNHNDCLMCFFVSDTLIVCEKNSQCRSAVQQNIYFNSHTHTHTYTSSEIVVNLGLLFIMRILNT